MCFEWHRLVTWVTGLAGTGLVATGLVSALSSYQSVYDQSSLTIAHQQFRLIETCMWLIVAVFGACLLVIARIRQHREERIIERAEAAAQDQSDGKQPPLVPKSSLPTGSSAAAKQQAREQLAAQGHRGRTPAKPQRRRGWFDSVG